MKLSVNRYPITSRKECQTLSAWFTVPNWEPKKGYKSGLEVVDYTPRQLHDHLTEGRTFTPAVFKDNRKSNANVLELSCFCVDVDSSKLGPHHFYDNLPKGLKPCFAYYTLSHGIKPDNRFRLVFTFPGPFTEEDWTLPVIKDYVSAFSKMCQVIEPRQCDGKPIIDTNATAPSNFFYGGNGQSVWWGDTVDLVELSNWLQKEDLLNKTTGAYVHLETTECEDALERLVLLNRVGFCKYLLSTCEEGRGATISKVARIIKPFNRNPDVYNQLKVAMATNRRVEWEPKHLNQFTRIFTGGVPGSFSEEYQRGEPSCRQKHQDVKELVSLVNNILKYQTLNQQIADDLFTIILESKLPKEAQDLIISTTVEKITYVNNKNTTTHSETIQP